MAKRVDSGATLPGIFKKGEVFHWLNKTMDWLTLHDKMKSVVDNVLTFNQGVTGSRPVRPTKTGRPSPPGSL